MPLSRGDRSEVGGNGLVELPLLGEAAVAVAEAGLQQAAAHRAPTGLGSDDKGVSGLVVKVVAARKETTPETVGVLLERHTEIIVYGIIHVHATEAVTLHIPIGDIGN